MATPTVLEREVKLRFASVEEARRSARRRRGAVAPPPAGGRAARRRAEALKQRRCVQRARRVGRSQPVDVQGPGSAVSDEAARRDQKPWSATARRCCAVSKAARLRGVVPLSEVSRRIRAHRRGDRDRRDAGRRLRGLEGDEHGILEATRARTHAERFPRRLIVRCSWEHRRAHGLPATDMLFDEA